MKASLTEDGLFPTHIFIFCIYSLFATSKDLYGEFAITHNVNGRSVYAQGTLDAVRFLDKKILSGEKGKVYSMMDVLKEA
jgi:4-hydroxy-tetrahydrodipicolinate reductase